MSRVPLSAMRAAVATLFVSCALLTGVAHAGTDVGSIHFTLGYKNLTKDWYLGPPMLDAAGDPIEPGRVNQPALGVELTWGRQGWPAQIAVDLLHSYDDGVTVVRPSFGAQGYTERSRAATLEIGLGLRRAWTIRGFSPYIGAGGSWVRGNAVVEISDPDTTQFGLLTASGRARASAFGYWAGVGICRQIGPRLQIGLAGRYSKATLPETPVTVDLGTLTAPDEDLVMTKLDAGGRTIQLVVGWSFPARP